MAARSKASVYGRLLSGVAGSNPTGDMNVVSFEWYVVRYSSLGRADHLSRGVLSNECDREAS